MFDIKTGEDYESLGLFNYKYYHDDINETKTDLKKIKVMLDKVRVVEEQIHEKLLDNHIDEEKQKELASLKTIANNLKESLAQLEKKDWQARKKSSRRIRGENKRRDSLW